VPNYHFNINGLTDGSGHRVVELKDLAEAKCEALKLAETVISDVSGTFWDGPEWMLIVTDDAGLTLFQLQVLGAEGPADQNLSRTGFGEGTFDDKHTADDADAGVDGA